VVLGALEDLVEALRAPYPFFVSRGDVGCLLVPREVVLFPLAYFPLIPPWIFPGLLGPLVAPVGRLLSGNTFWVPVFVPLGWLR